MARSTRKVPALNPIHRRPSGCRNSHRSRSADGARASSSVAQGHARHAGRVVAEGIAGAGVVTLERGGHRQGHLAHVVIRVDAQHEPIGNGGQELSDFGDGVFGYALDRTAFRPGKRVLDFPVLDVHRAVARTRRAEDAIGEERQQCAPRQQGDHERDSCSGRTPDIDAASHSVNSSHSNALAASATGSAVRWPSRPWPTWGAQLPLWDDRREPGGGIVGGHRFAPLVLACALVAVAAHRIGNAGGVTVDPVRTILDAARAGASGTRSWQEVSDWARRRHGVFGYPRRRRPSSEDQIGKTACCELSVCSPGLSATATAAARHGTIWSTAVSGCSDPSTTAAPGRT